ncbi:MAG: hypothetical protein ACREQZ_01105, partial [Woeseiaceae bacterium]
VSRRRRVGAAAGERREVEIPLAWRFLSHSQIVSLSPDADTPNTVVILLRMGFKAMDPRGQPAFILYVQTFGDLVTVNPHIHALVADPAVAK